jgi:hypothetical protein
MKRFVFILMIGFFLPTHPVWAEMYRYKDAAGVIRFTDNLSDVPESQRPAASVYEKGPSPAEPSTAGQPAGRNETGDLNQKLSESLPGNSDADFPATEENSHDPSRIDQLLKIKIALDAENAQLMKESLALSEERKTISGNAAVKAYNEKVIALNVRVDDYENRRAAFQKEADAFDAALKKRMAPPPHPPQPTSP